MLAGLVLTILSAYRCDGGVSVLASKGVPEHPEPVSVAVVGAEVYPSPTFTSVSADPPEGVPVDVKIAPVPPPPVNWNVQAAPKVTPLVYSALATPDLLYIRFPLSVVLVDPVWPLVLSCTPSNAPA